MLSPELQNIKSQNYSLDLTRGKPDTSVLDLANALLTAPIPTHMDGIDIRNYGVPFGLPSAKVVASDIIDIPPEHISIVSNSSMFIIQSILTTLWFDGLTRRAWHELERVKILCPVPGYDRHFALLQTFGIEMINVPMLDSGPDLKVVSHLLETDPNIVGMIGVPRHSNPSGTIWNAACLKELLSLCTSKNKENPFGFTLLMDHAYAIHDIAAAEATPNLLKLAQEAGCEESIFVFGSTSKLAFPGGGFGFVAMSENNKKYYEQLLSGMTLGSNKPTQARLVQFYSQHGGVRPYYEQQLRPKLHLALTTAVQALEQYSGNTLNFEIPKGGYFVSLQLRHGSAKEVVATAKEVGLALTPAGATHPYGIDHTDSFIRLAPTAIDEQNLELAVQILCMCVQEQQAKN